MTRRTGIPETCRVKPQTANFHKSGSHVTIRPVCLACLGMLSRFIMVAVKAIRAKSSRKSLLFVAGLVVAPLLLLFLLGRKNQKLQNDMSSSSTESVFAIGKPVPPWQKGYLDFHHIHSGLSVSTFVIFPDGTTMLIDCGDKDVKSFQEKTKKAVDWKSKLEVITPFPNDSKTTGGWVLDYLNQYWPHQETKRHKIDYMLNTHFHQDHFGGTYTTSQQEVGQRGSYLRSGLSEIGDELDVGTIIDRGYPNYDFPFDLERDWQSDSFDNYLKFVRVSAERGTKVEQFEVGSYSQIRMKNDSYGHFVIRNIKANLDVSPALPGNQTVTTIPGKLLYPSKKAKSGYVYDENKVSAAIVIEYGQFRYFEGGDQEFRNPDPQDDVIDLDTVTPTALVTGRVHVATLNHHGHGVRPEFCRTTDPKVLILQGWCNDQPPRESVEMLSAARKSGDTRDLFATFVFDTKLKELGDLAGFFKSTVGHVVVRVEPIGKEQKYHVFILDGSRVISKYFGPYTVD